MTSLPARFWAKVNKTETCWLWTATTNGGYGQFGSMGPGRTRYAHRLAYEDLVGPVPAGLDLDHIKERCGNRNCVNPDHLEPVTRQENVRRGRMIEVANARQWAKTHCPYGHPYDDANTKVSKDGRRRACRACANQRDNARYHAKRKAAA